MQCRMLQDELRDSKMQLRHVLEDVEEANNRDRRTQGENRMRSENEANLRRELEHTQGMLARLEMDHANLRTMHESVCGDRMRLEIDMDHFKGSAERAIA